MDNQQLIENSVLTPELYFLISKLLSAGPLQETAKVLVRELEEKKVLPKRIDWHGNEHEQSFAELERKYQHVSPTHLLQICERIGPILDKELTPSVAGIISLLGSGRQSLLRTRETIYRSRTRLDYCTHLHGVSLPDSDLTLPVHNLLNVLRGRESGVNVHRKFLAPTTLYSKTRLLRRTVGHLSAVYCVLFDRTGRYIITGADDLLIKIWSALDGRLLATLRGASAEITDIAINLDNTMLAAGSLDRILRVWEMQTTSPIAVLSGHTGMITSVNFCPSPRGDLKYLVTTSTDGSIAFWQYSTPRGQKTTFAPKPIQYHEKLRPGQAQMMCTTFSPGGMFLAAGSADHHVRVYIMSDDGPKRILESEVYTDAVDSVQWSHRGLRFISGSKDGTAHIWTFESQQWKSVKLSMTDRLSSCPPHEDGKKLKVTMVAWDFSDEYVITAVNDFTIKIWNSNTAKLHCVLRGHKDELYVLESNPKDKHILLSAGHDGQVFLWDINQGISVARFINDIDGQGHGGVFDAKWSPDGMMIAATDSHGHILIFGLGLSPDKYQILPNELFFHTDYRPLLRDASHHVVDEQTQVMPHLMPPPFLVDTDGNPHPAKYQRFVPGRENCSTDQLIPNITVGADRIMVEDSPNGAQNPANYERIDRLISALANRQGGGNASPSNTNRAQNNTSRLDSLIEALANRQGQGNVPDSNNRSRAAVGNVLGSGPSTSRGENNAPRRLSDAPRQGTTWGLPPEQQQQQQEPQDAQADEDPQQPVIKYVRRIYVRPMKYGMLYDLKQKVFAAGQFELLEYKREMRRRPIMISTANAIVPSGSGRQRTTRGNGVTAGPGRPGRRRGPSNRENIAYRTRAVRDQEVVDAPGPAAEEEEDDVSSTSGDTSYSNVEENLESSEDSDTDSSDYSDWVADTPGPNLVPPKRSKRKPLSRQRTLSDDSSDDATEQASTSANASAKLRKRNKKVVIPPRAANGEIPELYRPAEWLSEVIPRKAPYYPQMGDEVVYFRQGHERYLEAVRQKKVYKLTHSSEPWNFRTLRDREVVRVIGIKYEIRPPRLCCLKLALIDEDGNMPGTSFKIKYHDMPDVLDFLVLRQTFDLAVQRNWGIGSRFRCMIGDGWWMGKIESRHALSSTFPDSLFMCYRVRWDNGEYEYMSPWDMEPIDDNRLPDEVGGAVSVLPEEIRATLYQPKSEEWHRGDRDGTCRRIISGMEQVMRLSIAEHFLAPVDLNMYPDYAYLIEYPIDLTTIKSRFENHFYRRITSAQFDVRYLATNAEKYNRRHANIVKHARIVTDLCLRIIREPNDIDVAAVYHQLVDVYHSSESENGNESDLVPSTSTGPSTSAAARRTMSSATRRSNRNRSEGDWRADCRHLLDLMWQRPDSAAFREPVDTIEFPDYLEIIATPMDLRTVKEDLLGGNYEDPLDFAKDVRLIFQNSKNYNTNKRSRIYSMTLRLSALFESQIKTVISNWKADRRRANKKNARNKTSSGSATKRTTANRAAPSVRRTQRVKRRLHDSEDEDDDEEEEDDTRTRASQRQEATGGRNAAVSATGSASSSNRVTSSSHRRGAVEAQPLRTSRRRPVSQAEDDDDSDEEDATRNESLSNVEEDAQHASSSSSDSNADDSSEDGTSDDASDSHDDDDDDDSPTARRYHFKRGRGRKRKPKDSDEDSEESYKPNDRRVRPTKKRRTNSRRGGAAKAKRRKISDGDAESSVDHRRRGAGGGARKRNPRAANTNARSPRKAQARRALRSSDEGTAATPSQLDETTQESVSHTPKKRGRPARTLVDEGPSTSAGVGAESTRGRTRYNPNARPRDPHENDHSYHLPMRNGGRVRAESDQEARGAGARPTRARVKAVLDWSRLGVAEEESEDAEEILPTVSAVTAPRTNGPSSSTRYLNGPSTSRAAALAAAATSVVPAAPTATAVRQLRTNRNTVVEPPDDDSNDDDGSDNQPLASSQSSQQRAQVNGLVRRNFNLRTAPTVTSTPATPPHPMHLQRLTPHAVAISATQRVLHMTRSHATSTTTNVATSTSSHAFSAHDHNYLEDTIGPSTSRETARFTRRELSRHQRNADELDISTIDNTCLYPRSNRLRRAAMPSSTSTSTTNTVHAATSNGELSVRRGRSRYSQNSQSQEENNEEQDDEEHADETDEDEGASDVGTDGGSNSQSEEDTDSDDNQPLTSLVPAAKRLTKNRYTNQRRQRRRRLSDDSFVYHDNTRQQRRPPQQRSRRRRDGSDKSDSPAYTSRLPRGSRNQKRPRYNEQTDEEADSATTARHHKLNGERGTANVDSSGTAAATSSNRPVEPPDEITSDDDSDEQLVSVSSRGRVRKITAKARSIFKD